MRFSINARLDTSGLWKPNNSDLDYIVRLIAYEAISVMRQRAGAGIDVHGSAFKPYSAEYARRRRLSGRSTDVRLQLTGQMLNGIHITRTAPGMAAVGWGAKSDFVARFRRRRTKQGKMTSRALPGQIREIALAAQAGGVHRRKAASLGRKHADRATWDLVKTSETIGTALKASYVEEHGRDFFGIETQGDLAKLAAVARRAAQTAMAR